jgi:hypothetical protein
MRRFVQPLTLTAENIGLVLDTNTLLPTSPDSDLETDVGTPDNSDDKSLPVSESSDGYDSDELGIITRVPVISEHKNQPESASPDGYDSEELEAITRVTVESEDKNQFISGSPDGYDSDELEIITRVPVEDEHAGFRESKTSIDDFYVDYRGKGLAARYAMSTGKILYYVVTAKDPEGSTVRYLETHYDFDEQPEVKSAADKKIAETFVGPSQNETRKPGFDLVTFFSSNQKLETVVEDSDEDASEQDEMKDVTHGLRSPTK